MDHLDALDLFYCALPTILAVVWAWYSNYKIMLLEAENAQLRAELYQATFRRSLD
jgi:hypothetical protein